MIIHPRVTSFQIFTETLERSYDYLGIAFKDSLPDYDKFAPVFETSGIGLIHPFPRVWKTLYDSSKIYFRFPHHKKVLNICGKEYKL